MSGLAGHSAGYTHIVWLVATAIGVSLLAVLGIVYRRARTAHELEEADRLIEEAFGVPSPDDNARREVPGQ